MRTSLQSFVQKMDPEHAKRTLYELAGMDLNEDPLRGYELADIILFDNDEYDDRKAWIHTAPGHKTSILRDITIADLAVLDPDYADWLDAVQNSPDI